MESMKSDLSRRPFEYIADLHIFSHEDGCLVFHPASFSLFRVGAAFANLLLEMKRCGDLDRLAAKFGVDRAELETKLLDMRKRIEREREPTEPASLEEDPQREVGLTLHVSNACNLGCLYCYAQGGHYGRAPQRRMDKALALRAIDTMYRNFPNIRSIMFFGGEPLLAVDVIEEVCLQLRERHRRGEISSLPKLSLVTNGTLIDDRTVRVIREHAIQVTISVDGPKAINDRLRPYKNGRGSYDAIKHGFDRLVREVDQIPKIEATYTQVHRDQGMGMADLIEFLRQEFLFTVGTVAGVDLPKGDPLAVQGEESREDLKDALRRLVMAMARGEQPRMDRAFLFPIFLFIKRKGTRFTCSVAHDGFSITTDGEIYPCQVFVGKPEFLMGTVDDFDYHHPSPQLSAVLGRLIYADKERSPRCRHCWARAFCINCPGANIFAANGYRVPPVFCRHMRDWVETVLALLYDVRSDPVLWRGFLEGLKIISREVEENAGVEWSALRARPDQRTDQNPGDTP